MNVFRIGNIFTLFIILIPLQIYLPVGVAVQFTLAKLLSYLLFFWIIVRLYTEKKGIRQIPLDKFLILWLIIKLISITKSPYLHVSFEEVKRLLFFFAIYLTTIWVIANKKEIKFHIRTWLYVSFAIGLFGLYQMFQGTSGITSFMGSKFGYFLNGPYMRTIIVHEGIRWVSGPGNLTKIVGTFWDPNYYCQYLGFCIPVAVSMSIYSSKIKERVIYALGALLLMSNVIFTTSKSGWICLVGAIIVLLIFSARKFSIRGIILIGILLLLLFSLVLAYYLYSGSNIFSLQLERVKLAFQKDPRYIIWPVFWEQIWEHPFIGHGYYHADLYIPDFYRPYIHAHNVYLQLAFSTGFLGLSVFLAVLISWFRMAYYVYRRATEHFEKNIAFGLMGCILWFIAGNFVQDSLFIMKNGMAFWFILGITALLYNHVKSKETQKVDN